MANQPASPTIIAPPLPPTARLAMTTRARLGLALSPAERAALKLLESFLITGALAVLPFVAQIITGLETGTLHVNWSQDLLWLGAAFIVAVAHAAVKYLKARSSPTDQALGSWLDQLVARLATLWGVQNPVVPTASDLLPPFISARSLRVPAPLFPDTPHATGTSPARDPSAGMRGPDTAPTVGWMLDNPPGPTA